MRDSGNTVFGAWIGDGIKLSKGAYYGSGESCVFFFFFFKSPGPHFFLLGSFLWRYYENELEVFKWTGRNDYVALCDTEYISFGGG
jgi:TLD